jgi:hypothetical protein
MSQVGKDEVEKLTRGGVEDDSLVIEKIATTVERERGEGEEEEDEKMIYNERMARVLQSSPTLAPTQLPFPPTSDLQVLRDIYESLNGKFWKWKKTRNDGIEWFPNSTANLRLSNPCSTNWQGVACSCNDINNVTARNTMLDSLPRAPGEPLIDYFYAPLIDSNSLTNYYFDDDGSSRTANIPSSALKNQTLLFSRKAKNRCRVSRLNLENMGHSSNLRKNGLCSSRKHSLHECNEAFARQWREGQQGFGGQAP